MGNYHNLEYEFVERTMKLISQYEDILDVYDFEEQYNYTLTVNCLLGLIVMPKEKVMTFIPNSRLTNIFKREIGLVDSIINEDIRTLRDLIQSLRHSIAHFDIDVISEDEQHHIDWIEFKDTENEEVIIAKFKSNEIVPFLKYYSSCLLRNLRQYGH